MSMNPFNDDDGRRLVSLVDERHRNGWPTFAAVPVGRPVVYGDSDRAGRLDYAGANWPDTRLMILREKLAGGRAVDT